MGGLMSKRKGANGEREAIAILNNTIEQIISNNEFDEECVRIARECIQRNQNQSAVGGCDLSNVFGLAFEIKRQEQLNINTWWKQTTDSAERNREHPVLLYRQNHQPWRCITMGNVPLPGGRAGTVRVQMEEDDFKVWFYQWVYYKLASGDLPRV